MKTVLIILAITVIFILYVVLYSILWISAKLDQYDEDEYGIRRS